MKMSMNQINKEYFLKDQSDFREDLRVTTESPLAAEVKTRSKYNDQLLRHYEYHPKPKEITLKLEQKSIMPSWETDFIQIFGGSGRLQGSYVSNARYGHMTNPYVFACVNKIQQTTAGINLFLVQHTTDEDGEQKEEPVEDEENPLVRLFKRPNSRQRWAEWLKERIGHRYYGGEWFTYKTVAIKDVTELTNLRPDRMKEVPNKEKTEIDHWEYKVDGVLVKTFKPEEISHVKTFNPLDDWRGLAPVSVARAIIDTLNAAKIFNKSLLENDAKISGNYAVPGVLNTAQYERIKQQLRERYQGPRNVGNIMVTEGGAKFEVGQFNPHELDFIEGQKMNAREISIILQVPSELLNDSTNKTYSNQREAVDMYYHDCVLPLLDEIIDELNEFVVRPYDPTMELKYDPNDIEALKEDMTQKVQREALKIQNGIASPNEVRPEFGLSSDVPNGDSLFIDGNKIAFANVKKKVAEIPPEAPEEKPKEEQGEQEKEQVQTVNVEDFL